jgi:hypothetical protein
LLSPELFFEDFTEIEALTSLWITTIISINPIITRNTMLSDINDIISAPEGPEKWALNEIASDILMTSKLTYTPKGRYPALDLAGRAHKQIPFETTGNTQQTMRLRPRWHDHAEYLKDRRGKSLFQFSNSFYRMKG